MILSILNTLSSLGIFCAFYLIAPCANADIQMPGEEPPSDAAADVPKAPPVSQAVFPCHRIEYEEPGTQLSNIIKAASASCNTLMGKNSGGKGML